MDKFQLRRHEIEWKDRCNTHNQFNFDDCFVYLYIDRLQLNYCKFCCLATTLIWFIRPNYVCCFEMKTIMKMNDETMKIFMPAKAVFWVQQHLATCQWKTAKRTKERKRKERNEYCNNEIKILGCNNTGLRTMKNCETKERKLTMALLS